MDITKSEANNTPAEHAADPAEIGEQDLESVAGGASIDVRDAYDILNEAWSDIKQGFVDAMND